MGVDAEHGRVVMVGALEVACVPVLSDNYVWLIHDAETDETVVVDPGDAAPVLAAAEARGWRISAIWNTHWHPDHTAGNAGVREATGAPITGPAAEASKIGSLDVQVADGDTVRIGSHVAQVLATPGHTAGHIVFHFADDRLLFSGDTLFAMGCGRLFEGTAAEMFANMRRFEQMPDETVVYGAHEYTLGNGRYALTVEPDNAALRDRMVEVERLRAADQPTLPTNMALEGATNPFLRAQSIAEFAERRAAKDSFRG